MILNDVSFKFTQDVEYKFYSEINAIFNQLSDFEIKMREIALKAAQGEYGNIANRAKIDLDIQF